MKIYGLDPKIMVPAGTKTNQTNTVDFHALLRSQLEAVNKTAQTTPVAKAEPEHTAPPALRIEGLALTEASLDTLEAFSAALGNNLFDNASLAPFADTLQEETAALMAVRKQLPNDDPLAAILDRVATQAYVESAKFNRGDYTA